MRTQLSNTGITHRRRLLRQYQSQKVLLILEQRHWRRQSSFISDLLWRQSVPPYMEENCCVRGVLTSVVLWRNKRVPYMAATISVRRHSIIWFLNVATWAALEVKAVIYISLGTWLWDTFVALTMLGSRPKDQLKHAGKIIIDCQLC